MFLKDVLEDDGVIFVMVRLLGFRRVVGVFYKN